MTNTVTKEQWCFDITSAPQGHMKTHERTNKKGVVSAIEIFAAEPCLIATKCGKVIISHVLENGRWNFLAEDELPIAWQSRPAHPNEMESTQ